MAGWSHDAQYTDGSECDHCGAGGVLLHQPWCVSINKRVAQAWEMLLFPEKVNAADQQFLHTVGICWDEKSRVDGKPARVVQDDDGA